jgi:hypothetical protein
VTQTASGPNSATSLSSVPAAINMVTQLPHLASCFATRSALLASLLDGAAESIYDPDPSISPSNRATRRSRGPHHPDLSMPPSNRSTRRSSARIVWIYLCHRPIVPPAVPGARIVRIYLCHHPIIPPPVPGARIVRIYLCDRPIVSPVVPGARIIQERRLEQLRPNTRNKVATRQVKGRA